MEIQPTTKPERNRNPLPDENPLRNATQEPAKAEKSGEITANSKEQMNLSGAVVEEQEGTVTTSSPRSEKLSEEKSLGLEVKQRPQEIAIHKSEEVPSQKAEQTEPTQPNNQDISNDQHELASSEPSGAQPEGIANDKTADDARQTTLHKRDNSSGSGDSSWSKISYEDLKTDGDKGGTCNNLLLMIIGKRHCFDSRINSISCHPFLHYTALGIRCSRLTSVEIEKGREQLPIFSLTLLCAHGKVWKFFCIIFEKV